MATENYKKFIVAGIGVLAAVIIIVSFVSPPPVKQERASERSRSPVPSGPMIDQDLTKVVPVEELGVDLGDFQALALLGDRYFETRKYNQAIEIYKKVIEINPQDVDTFNDLGLSYFYMKQAGPAVETLKKGTEVNPSYQRIWLSLGFVLMSLDNKEEAIPALLKAAELDPQSIIGEEAVRMLGLIK